MLQRAGFLLTALLIAVSADECDHSSCKTVMSHYYKELSCHPIHEDGSCCPVRFDCSHLSNREANRCYVGEQSFEIGTTVDKEHHKHPCMVHCHCVGDDNSTGYISCANIECPRHMGVTLPPGCRSSYKPGDCCASGTICENANSAEDFKCQHGDHTHLAGEQFYPDGTDLKCVCVKEFDGTLREPWCSEIRCGLDVHYGQNIKDGCAPIFYGTSRICPIDWRCPKDTDTVIPADDTNTDTHVCTFGSLHLKLNEKLNPEGTCEECTCSVPPHVSCIRTSC